MNLIKLPYTCPYTVAHLRTDNPILRSTTERIIWGEGRAFPSTNTQDM